MLSLIQQFLSSLFPCSVLSTGGCNHLAFSVHNTDDRPASEQGALVEGGGHTEQASGAAGAEPVGEGGVLPELRIEKIESTERLREIADAWKGLLSRSRGRDFFLLPDWLFAWWDICGMERAPYFVAMWDGDMLCALVPLCRRRRGPFRVLFFAGMPRYSDRLDVLIEPGWVDAALDDFTIWLYQQNDWDVLSMRSFGPLSDHPERLREAMRAHGRTCLIEPETTYYYIPCEEFEGFEGYLNKTRSGKTRSEMRRMRRRLEERHGVTWEVRTGLTVELIDKMAELDQRRSFRGAAGECFFCRPTSRALLLAVTARIAPEHLRIATASIGDRLVAYTLCFDYDNRLLSYQTAYDKEFHRDSLGNHTLMELIRWGFDNGYREYDFLAGEEDYKNDWTKAYRQARRFHAYRKDWRSGLLYAYHRWVKPLRRRLKQVRWLVRLVPKPVRDTLDI